MVLAFKSGPKDKALALVLRQTRLGQSSAIFFDKVLHRFSKMSPLLSSFGAWQLRARRHFVALTFLAHLFMAGEEKHWPAYSRVLFA